MSIQDQISFEEYNATQVEVLTIRNDISPQNRKVKVLIYRVSFEDETKEFEVQVQQRKGWQKQQYIIIGFRKLSKEIRRFIKQQSETSVLKITQVFPIELFNADFVDDDL